MNFIRSNYKDNILFLVSFKFSGSGHVRYVRIESGKDNVIYDLRTERQSERGRLRWTWVSLRNI